MASIKFNWWPFYPYTISHHPDGSKTSNTNSLRGFLFDILIQMFQSCQPALDTSNFQITEYTNQQDFTLLLTDPDVPDGSAHIYVPVSIPDQGCYPNELRSRMFEHSTFLPVIESPGAVHFYKKKDEAVGSDLVAVILQGWPMLILILLGAGYSGIIIWLLDRLWNPSNFPKPFIRGFWEGFWWAFVTMTTVGYGDTTPRSLQARVYGLVWIVVGITILSVFTATVTTVLTQQSIGNVKSLHGITAAVLNGTWDFRAAIENGAKPLPVNDLNEMVQLLTEEVVEAGLLDQFAFASQQDLLSANALIQDTVSNPTIHGIVLQSNDTSLIKCSQAFINSHQYEILHELQTWIKPLTVETTSAAESAEKLFQPRTILYMWYCLAVWVFIFILFVLWEFLYWRPKHRRRKVIKAKLAMEREKKNKEDLNSDEQPPRPKHNFPKPVQNTTKRSFQLRSKIKKHQTNEHYFRPDIDSYGNMDILAGKSYKNEAYQNDNSSDEVTMNFESQDDIDENNFEDLKDLVRRQSIEIHELEDEYQAWYETYTHRVDTTKLRHKEEQRQLLRSLQRQRFYEKADTHAGPVFPPNMSHSYPIYHTGIFTTRSTSRSVATTYRPYTSPHRFHNSLNHDTAMPVDRL